MEIANALTKMGLASLLALAPAANAQAADIVIGVGNWTSILATAHVIKTIMEDNLGLTVELQNGTNPIIFEAMGAGSMDVHPEVWLPAQSNLREEFVEKRKVVVENPGGITSFQGMCVTKGTVEQTGIKALSDLTDPEMAKLFDTNGDGKGEMWIGAPGWSATPVERIRAKSYGYAETMDLKEMDEALAYAEVDNAVAQNRPIVFFCYTPHHIFAMHDLVVLKEPPHDPAKWHVIQPTDDPDWLQKSDAAVGWDSTHQHIYYAAALAKKNPAAALLLSHIHLTNEIVSGWTYALAVKGQDPAEYAKTWVAENRSLVDSWLQ